MDLHKVSKNRNRCSKFLFLFLKNGKQDRSAADSDKVPTPVVIIDQDSDPDATVVEVTFGDRLGALLDTVMTCSSYSTCCFSQKLFPLVFFEFFILRVFIIVTPSLLI